MAYPPLPRCLLRPISIAVLAALACVEAAEPTAPTVLRADEVEGQTEDKLTAKGNVFLKRGDQQLESDWLRLFEASKEIYAGDKTKLTQKGDVLTGGQLYIKDDTREGYLESPIYQLGKRNGRGDALRLLFNGPEKYRLNEARYTTCPANVSDWYVRAHEMDLDYTRNLGTGYHTTIEFKGVPLLYAPWMDFSLDGARKSGFLAPTIGTTGSGGFDFSMPYYWNIAPNRDATITPRFIAKRGVLVNGEFRYLDPTYAGQVSLEVIPQDRVFASSRNAFSWQHGHNLAPGWRAESNIQRASDDLYFADFGDRIAVASKLFLPQEGTVFYNGVPGLNVAMRVQRYQTLQDPVNPVSPPYARLPQVTAAYNMSLAGLPLDIQTEAVRFAHPTKIKGDRFTAYPSLRLPLTSSYGFLIGKIGAHISRYQLGDGRDLSRNLPIFSLDGGLLFDREFNFAGRDLVQSLEPRVYYVRIPYRDQSTLPNFDSSLTGFNFAQMFNENQFTGGDRINDANQLTLAVTSRLFNADDGAERLRVAVGQRFNLSRSKVYLNTPGDNGGDANESNLVAAVGGQPSEHWWLDSAWQYNRQEGRTQKLGLSLRYQPRYNSLINLRYRLDKVTDIKQIDLSAQWPIYGNWYGLARENWSIRDQRTLEGLLGVEYNGGCWVFRLVAQRFVTPGNLTKSTFFLQLELNDLGKLGSNPLETLKQSIPGYNKLN